MKDFIISTKIQVYQIEKSDGNTKKLINKAKEATKNAYSPYSKYSVGAAVLLDNDEIITGNNQENAAYPSGLCAERTALFYANSNFPNNSIKAIAIIAYYNGEFVKNICTPCGSCRQVLAEIENRYNSEIRIIMCSKDQAYEVKSIKDLLPLIFNNNSME